MHCIKRTAFILLIILRSIPDSRTDDDHQRATKIATTARQDCKLFPSTNLLSDYLPFVFEMLGYFANVSCEIGRAVYFVLDTTVITICQVITNVFSGVHQLANFFEFFGKFLQAILEVNYNLVSSGFAWFQGLFQAIKDFIKYILESLWWLVSSCLKNILTTLHNVVRSISSLFDFASHGVTTTYDTTGVALHKSYDSVTYMVSLPGSALMTTMNTVRAIVELLLMTIINTVVFFVELVINFFLLLCSYIYWAFSGIWTFITKVCDKIVTLGKYLQNGLKYLVTSLYESVKSVCDSVVHAILFVIEKATKAVLSVFYYIGWSFVVSLLEIYDTAMKGFTCLSITLKKILTGIQYLCTVTPSYTPGGLVTVISLSSSSFVIFCLWFVYDINLLSFSFEKLEVFIQVIVSLLTQNQSNTESIGDEDEAEEIQFRDERAGPSMTTKIPGESNSYSTEELKRKLAQEKEKNLCVVCQDQSKCVLIMPCKHLCVCRRCADILIKRSSWRLRICPLCRGRIISTMDVYA